MKRETAITQNARSNILEMATKKRHIYLLEKMQIGKSLTKSELEELKEFESHGKKETEKPSAKEVPIGIVKTIPEVAKQLGCTSRTVRNWVSEGMPVGPNKTFDIEAIRMWRQQRDNRRKPSESEELDNKIRRIRLKNLELDHKQKIGQLISLNDVEQGRVARILAVKQELLALPRALAKLLENCEARKIETILREKIDQTIKKFSGQ
jgi:phage terminase Nu1 subunit (DNA packaging protein)